jgi:glycosyltransferase involved in cell wall biosynthesis
MRILFLSHQSHFIYGGEIVTLAFIRALKKRGVHCELALPRGILFDRALKEGVRVHEISAVEFSRRWRNLPHLLRAQRKVRRELATILDQGKFTHLHAMSLKAMIYARALRRKTNVVWHHHNILPNTLRNHLWCRWIGKGVSRVIVPSLATKVGLVGVPAEKIDVIYNGFETEAWKVRPPRKEERTLTLAVIGELSHRKGQDRILRLLLDWKERAPPFNLRVLLIGSSLSEKAFEADLRRMFSGYSVEFLGRREDVPNLLPSIDVLLVPSRNDPFPTVIIEAALSGVPVIGARVDGIPEMIEEGASGFLFYKETELFPLLEKMAGLENWAELSRKAREFGEKKFSLERSCGQLIDSYRKANRA